MMDGGKCTFGTRPPVDLNMLNEKIHREIKHFRNYKIYTPNFASTPVTTKFYAAHDQVKIDSEEEEKKIHEYGEKVMESRIRGPKVKYSEPATENMVYGWHTTPLMKYDRNDIRFYHPKVESPSTKVEVIIAMANPKKKA